MAQLSREEIEALYRQHQPWARVYGVRYKLNHADAEDLFQTAFMQAAQKYDPSQGPFRPFLLRLIYNSFCDGWRRTGAEPAGDDIVDLADATDVDADPEMLTRTQRVIREVQEIIKADPQGLVPLMRRMSIYFSVTTWDEVDAIDGAGRGVSCQLFNRKRREILREAESGNSVARRLFELWEESVDARATGKSAIER